MSTKKKPIKYVLKRWEFESYQTRMLTLENKIKRLEEASCIPSIKIFSADKDVCIGMNSRLWHKIVCKYNGEVCEGGPRPHWTSKWKIDDSGFHLEEMIDEHWKGWRGQYRKDNELKYDELPRDVLQVHHNCLVEHIKNMSIYYPCHIYNDFTGELYRP